MKKHIYKLIVIISALFTFLPSIVQADAESNVLQVYISDQTMTVFTDIQLNSDKLKCMISNQRADITSTGSLSDENALTKTTILVDVSTSIPSDIRDGVMATLNQLVDRKAANEEFKLVAFGDELNVLQELSPDRYELAVAAGKIQFSADQSKIYDAIYNTIPAQLIPANKKTTFYRTIVITDGADDTVSGITKEELYLKLQNQRYPVDVVAVSSEETTENKELAALVRMSRGRYFSLSPKTDLAALSQKLAVNGYCYIEAKAPLDLLDGTTRQVDLSDGVYHNSIDIKFPVFNAPGAETAETSTSSVTESKKSDAKPPYAIYIGGAIGLIAILTIVAAAAKRRKKKQEESPPPKSGLRSENSLGYQGNSGRQDNNYVERTEFASDTNFADAQFTIKLSSLNSPSKTWTLPVNGEVLIGRAEYCPVRLDNKSVSREQCKITVQDGGLAILNLSSTNKTSLNGGNVLGREPLQSGDTLRFGREALHIDYIQMLGTLTPKPETPPRKDDGNTVSIF